MLVNTISVPSSARLFFCTDVHGRLDELTELLSQAGFTETDYLISVGDLTDRGPKSLEALNMFLNPTKQNLHALLGNHEHMLMQKDLHNLFDMTISQDIVIGFFLKQPAGVNKLNASICFVF